MEGKIVSYYHHGYQAFVFLGCTMESPSKMKNIQNGQKPFNPDNIPGCVNALGSNKDIALQNLIPPESNTFDMTTANKNL